MLAPPGILLLGALSALVFPRLPQVPYGFALAGGLASAAVAALAPAGAVVRVHLPAALPYTALGFRLDGLSAWFLLITGLVTAAVALYALGYVDRRHYGSPAAGAAFCAFAGAMAALVLADGVFSFLLFWELMTVASFVVVLHDHHLPEVRRAAFVYLAMTHAGTAFITGGFLLLAGTAGSLDFDAFRTAASALPPLLRDGAFLLFLTGFAAKAGVVPLHVWLPRAHPAAPSHGSALMSGVMIKTAIYGLLRVTTEFLAPAPEWWGWLVLGLGAASAVLGVLYALMEHDLKRLLAYHSVENIGIILLGAGAAMVLAARGATEAAGLAMVAALFHTLNHALFKALLFLGAGAVQRATGTRDLERLGGLIRTMPVTAALFLLGSAAIAAVPPLNGFASEWMTFQALLQVVRAAGSPLLVAGGAVATGALALTAGLAAFCFVKAFGVAFLGVPRSAAAGGAREVAAPMLLGMAALAVPCGVLGVLPDIATGRLETVAAAALAPSVGPAPQIAAAAVNGIYLPLTVFGLATLLAGAAALTVRLAFGPGSERVAPPWVCGVALEPRMQYTASALAKPVRIIFARLLRPYRAVEHRYSQAGYFVAEVHYEAGVRPVYEAHLYRPLVGLVLQLAAQVRRLQSGSLRLYLSFIFATLLVVLLVTR